MPFTSGYFNSFSTFHAVKHDCVFGDDFDLNEISYVSEVFWSSPVLLPSVPLILIWKLRLVISWKILWKLLITCHSIQVLKEFDRPIVYSLSPGTSVTPAMAKDVSGLVNMYRITGDDWDTWEDVKYHFDIARWLHRYILLQHICICLQSTLLLFYFWIPDL